MYQVVNVERFLSHEVGLKLCDDADDDADDDDKGTTIPDFLSSKNRRANNRELNCAFGYLTNVYFKAMENKAS